MAVLSYHSLEDRIVKKASLVGDYVRDYVETNEYSWTFVIDATGEVAEEYMVTLIPANFFIDRKGVIQVIRVGAMSKATMEALLAETME